MDDKFLCQAQLMQQQHIQQQQQFTQRMMEHLTFSGDILDRWHRIGSSQGLATDVDVATFLIQHYENTWDRARPTEYCLTCHNPLSLTCTKCQPNQAATTTTSTSTTTATASNLPENNDDDEDTLEPFFDGGDNFSVDPVHHPKPKEKKRHKKSKSKSMACGPSDPIDTEEDLMGLYMKFAQSQASESKLVDTAAGDTSKSSSRLKSYLCVHCGKTIFKPSDFKKHVRTHTREKPYKCDRCPAAFSDPSSACRHRRTHTGEKPYVCKLCPSSFAQSSDLTKHMRVHSGERPWQCQFCDRTFADTSSFARHRRQHEKMELKLQKMAESQVLEVK